MSDKPRAYQAELRQVLNALAEDVAEISDKELLAEASEPDLATDAEGVRSILRRVVEKFKRRKLHEAQEAYRLAAASLAAKKYDLPKTPQERRSLLTLISSSKPQIQEMLTVQFRELSKLSDADVESTLRKFAELGLLEEPASGEKGIDE